MEMFHCVDNFGVEVGNRHVLAFFPGDTVRCDCSHAATEWTECKIKSSSLLISWILILFSPLCKLDLEFVKLTAGKTDRFYEDGKPASF